MKRQDVTQPNKLKKTLIFQKIVPNSLAQLDMTNPITKGKSLHAVLLEAGCLF